MSTSIDTGASSQPPSAPFSDSSSSSPASLPPPSPVATWGTTLLSWAALITIVVAWFKGMLAGAPWWGPLLALVLVAMPGGVLVGVVQATAGPLLAKLTPGGK